MSEAAVVEERVEEPTGAYAGESLGDPADVAGGSGGRSGGAEAGA